MTYIPTRPARVALLAVALVAPAAGAQVATPRPTVAPAAAPDSARVISLDDAMRLAVERSETVRIARAGVERARGQVMQARSQFLPQLNGTAAYQRQLKSQFQEVQKRFAPAQPTGPQPQSACFYPATPTDSLAPCPAAADGFGAIGQIFASENTVILGLTGSQNLFAGGRITSGFRAAGAGRRAAEIGLVAQQAQVRYDVAQAYFDAQLAERLAVIAESSFVQAERALRQTSLARQVGNASEFEALRARVTRDNARPAVIQARTQRDVARLRLLQLLDLPADAPVRLTTDIEAGMPAPAPTLAAADSGRGRARPAIETRPVSQELDVDALLAEDSVAIAAADSVVATADTAAGDRSSVRQAEASVDAQRNLLRAARGQRLPALQLSTNYQRFAYPTSGFPDQWADFYPNWSVTLGLSVPIFTGGRIRGDEMVAQANLVEARETLQQAREYAALDARLAVAQLRQAQAAWQASLGTAEVAQRAFTIADVRYREGISTQLELSESRVQLQQALANRASAARDLQVARMRLALLRDLPLSAAGQAAGAASPGTQTMGGSRGAQQGGATRGATTPTQQAAGQGGATQGTTGNFE